MKAPAHVLLWAIACSALPLRKGAELGYQVWRSRQADSSFTRLAVVDGSATDSGAFWKVAIRDSVLGQALVRTDSATIRVRGTDTSWSVTSALAEIDLDPIDSARMVDTYLGRLAFPPPQASWIPDTGAGWFRDGGKDETWILREVDGHPLGGDRPWSKPVLPLSTLRPGETWTWWVRDSIVDETNRFSPKYLDERSRLRWEVIDSAADSAGWLRRQVLTSRPGAATTDSVIEVRIERSTGRAATSSIRDVDSALAAGMSAAWTDRKTDDSTWQGLQATWNGFSGCEPCSMDSSRHITKAGTGTVLLVRNSFYKFAVMSQYVRSLRIQLEEHDGVFSPVDSGWEPSPTSLTRPIRTADLRSILDDPRGLDVRIFSPRGNPMRLTRATEISSLHGILLVEIRHGGSIDRFRVFAP